MLSQNEIHFLMHSPILVKFIKINLSKIHSGLLAGVLGWGDVQGRYGDTFGGIRGGHWGGRAGFGGGCIACVGRVFVCVGIGFHRSTVWQISFWCSIIVCQAFGWGDWFQCALSLFGVGGVAVRWLAWALWG